MRSLRKGLSRARCIICRTRSKTKMWDPLFRKQEKSAAHGTEREHVFISSVVLFSTSHVFFLFFFFCYLTLFEIKKNQLFSALGLLMSTEGLEAKGIMGSSAFPSPSLSSSSAEVVG